jgi:hypothetical protein
MRAIASRSGTAVGCCLGTGLGPSDHAVLTVDPKPDQGADDAADLDRLVFGEVAQMGDLDLPVGILVDGERAARCRSPEGHPVSAAGSLVITG